MDPVNNNPPLVQIVAWSWSTDGAEVIMARLTQIWSTRHRRVNTPNAVLLYAIWIPHLAINLFACVRATTRARPSARAALTGKLYIDFQKLWIDLNSYVGVSVILCEMANTISVLSGLILLFSKMLLWRFINSDDILLRKERYAHAQ